MRHRVSADSDLELIPLEWDEPDVPDVPVPRRPKRTATPFVWLAAAVGAAGLLASGAFASHLFENDKPPAPPRSREANADVPNVFTVHLEQLKGQGLVALASDGHVRVLDGDNQVMRDVDRHAAVSDPMWSPSGRWLSFVVANKQIWVMRADETEAQQAGAVGVVRPDTVAWSTRTDTLAMVTSAGLELIAPEGPVTAPLPHTAGASSVSWSPDGTRIALVSTDGAAASLAVLDESSAGEHAVARVPAADGDLRLAGWWPDGGGVLAWKVPTAPSSAADGAELVSISVAGKEAQLTTMLPYLQWVSWSPDHRHVVVVEGAAREASRAKHLAVCDVSAGQCRSVATPPGTVALDPAWSPDGTKIAYVQADDDAGAGFGNWLGTRQLWTMQPDGSDAKRLGALDGVDAPRWFPDGKRLLSVGGENALWLVDPTFVGPVASRLYEGEFPPGYSSGFVDWSRTLAWHQP